MNPDMLLSHSHGTVWFDVSGFGRVKREFRVNSPEELVNRIELSLSVAHQVMVLDVTLTKREAICKPVTIDIRACGIRRVVNLATLEVTLEQTL